MKGKALKSQNHASLIIIILKKKKVIHLRCPHAMQLAGSWRWHFGLRRMPTPTSISTPRRDKNPDSRDASGSQRELNHEK